MNKLIALAEAAAEIGVSRYWLKNWLENHPADGMGMPFYVPIGRRKRFDSSDIDRMKSIIWEQQHCGRQPGWIYIAGFANYVKVGFTSKSVEDRITSLQTGCPETLTLYASMKGSMDLEARLHRKFSAYMTQGEWFRREGE